MKMMQKRQVTTSWPISFFWVFLSVTMAILATYSFLQADWVIKRNLVVTNYYQPENHTHQLLQSSSLPLSSSFSPNSPAASRGRSDSPFLIKRNVTTHPLLLHLPHNVHKNVSHYYGIGSGSSSSNVNSHSSNHHNYVTSNHEETPRPGLHVRRVIKVTKVITTIRFGTIGVCSSVGSAVQCKLYASNDLYQVSTIWSVVTIIGGCGCMTLCVSAVLSILAIALPSSQLRHQVASTIGHAQTVAVVLLFLALLLFPLGFDSDFVRYHCGVFSGPYSIADCEIGWAYALVLVCASLALYCPVLVKFTADIRYDALPKYL